MKIGCYVAYTAFVTFMVACAAAPIRKDIRQGNGEFVSARIAPGGKFAVIETRSVGGAPMSSIWNAMRDLERVYTNFPDTQVLSTRRIDENSARIVLEVDRGWYSPAVTMDMMLHFSPEKLRIEGECIGGGMGECRYEWLAYPFGDGKRVIGVLRGYQEIPWWVPDSMALDTLTETLETSIESFDLRVESSRYSAADPRYPWMEFNALAVPVTAATESPAASRPMARIAVPRFQVYGGAETDTMVATIAANYLADALRRTTRQTVVSGEEMEMMARYLGQRWALVCKSDDVCEKRVAEMVEADYVLSGDLKKSGDGYLLHMALFNPATSSVVWSTDDEIRGGLEPLRDALSVVAETMSHVTLQTTHQ